MDEETVGFDSLPGTSLLPGERRSGMLGPYQSVIIMELACGCAGWGVTP